MTLWRETCPLFSIQIFKFLFNHLDLIIIRGIETILLLRLGILVA